MEEESDEGKPSLLKSLEGHTGGVLSASFSLDQKYLCSVGDDHVIRFWNLETLSEEKHFIGHTSWIRCVDNSPDGKLVASGSFDMKIILWDSNDIIGNSQEVLEGHEEEVTRVHFFSGGKSLVSSGGGDRTIKIWDIETKKCVSTIRTSSFVHNVDVSSTSEREIFLSGGGNPDQGMKLWDSRDPSKHVQYFKSESDAYCVRFHPHRDYLVTGSGDNIKTYDIRNSQLLDESSSQGIGKIRCFSLHPMSGNIIIAGDEKCGVSVYDLSKKEFLFRMKKVHKYFLQCITFSPLDGSFFATGTDVEELFMWKSDKLKLFSLVGHHQKILKEDEEERIRYLNETLIDQEFPFSEEGVMFVLKVKILFNHSVGGGKVLFGSKLLFL